MLFLFFPFPLKTNLYEFSGESDIISNYFPYYNYSLTYLCPLVWAFYNIELNINNLIHENNHKYFKFEIYDVNQLVILIISLIILVSFVRVINGQIKSIYNQVIEIDFYAITKTFFQSNRIKILVLASFIGVLGVYFIYYNINYVLLSLLTLVFYLVLKIILYLIFKFTKNKKVIIWSFFISLFFLPNITLSHYDYYYGTFAENIKYHFKGISIKPNFIAFYSYIETSILRLNLLFKNNRNDLVHYDNLAYEFSTMIYGTFIAIFIFVIEFNIHRTQYASK